MDKWDLPFSTLAERHYFVDLLLVLYLLLGFLVISLFLPIAPVGLGLLSLIALSYHRFFQSFSLFGIECDIGVGSLVLGTPWF